MGKRSPLAAQRAETEVRSKAVSLPASLRLRGAGIKAINGVSSEAMAGSASLQRRGVLIATENIPLHDFQHHYFPRVSGQNLHSAT